MEKKKYYVSIASSEISQIPFGNNDDFTISATADEVRELRIRMDQMHSAEMGSFFRAQIPIVPYHHDQSNDHYDSGLMAAFQMIYDLGDEEAREHIASMGILSD